MKHDMSGHLLKYVDGKYQYEHILKMEQKLGRSLRPDEIVHHIDGDPNNNALSNLKVMTRGEHNKEDASHHKGGRTKGSKDGVRKDTYNKDKSKAERYDT